MMSMLQRLRILRAITIPAITLGIFFFLYIPIIVLVAYSFQPVQSAWSWTNWTLHWYRELLDSPDIWYALSNSIIVAVCSSILSVSMGVLAVYAWGHRHAKFLLSFYASVLIPEIVLAVGLLSVFALLQVPLGLTTLIVGHTLLGLGFVIPLIHGRFLELDQHLIEASLDLGATHWQTFWQVIVPILRPAIGAAALLVLIISFDDFLISFFCTGAYSQTLSLYIFAMIRAGVSPTINALSTVLLVVASLLVLIFSRLSLQDNEEDEDE